MRYILIILVFLSVGANAQMVIKAHANYRPYASPSVNLLLDDYPNAAAAYSLRKLDKDYTGSAIRVRRSNDNSEQDIGFTSSGDLETASLKTFVGANSGFVTTWYDQSGSSPARNATQSTAANQPRVVNAGTVERQGSRPTVSFDGDNDRLINNSINQAQPITCFLTSKNNRTGTTTYSIFYDGYNAQNIFYRGITGDQANNFTIAAGNASYQFTTASNTDFNLFYILLNQLSSKLQVNNNTELSAAQTIGANNLNGISIGNIRGNPSPVIGGAGLLGLITELVFYGSDQSTNKTGIQNNINTYYSIY